MMQTMHFEISHSHSDLPMIKEQFMRRAKLSQKGETHKAAQGNAVFLVAAPLWGCFISY